MKHVFAAATIVLCSFSLTADDSEASVSTDQVCDATSMAIGFEGASSDKFVKQCVTALNGYAFEFAEVLSTETVYDIQDRCGEQASESGDDDKYDAIYESCATKQAIEALKASAS